MNERTTGYLLLALSVVCNGSAIHFTRQATTQMPALWVVTLLCLIGPVGSVGLAAVLRALRSRSTLAVVSPRSQWSQMRLRPSVLLFAATTGALGAACTVWVIATSGAATAAFLGNLTLVFLVLFGVVRGEAFDFRAGVAAVVVIAGAFIFALSDKLALTGSALAFMALGCLASALKQTSVRFYVARADVPSFAGAKQIAMGVLLATVAYAVTGTLPTRAGVLWTIPAALLQSTAGMPLLYLGYHAVGLAQGAPIDTLRPVVVLLIGLGLGEALPGPVRLVGAGMIVAGAAFLAARQTAPKLEKNPQLEPDHEEIRQWQPRLPA